MLWHSLVMVWHLIFVAENIWQSIFIAFAQFLPPWRVKKPTQNLLMLMMVVLAKYRPFGPFDPMPDEKTMKTRCLGVRPLCGYQNFYTLPWKLGFLAKKRANSAQNWHFWPNINRPCRFIWCPVGLCCGARAVSRSTPIYFLKLNPGLGFETRFGQ